MRKLLPALTIIALLLATLALTAPVKAANSWAVGNLVGLCKNTEIRQGPGYSYSVHTIVPEDNWTVKVIDGPRYADGQTWWDTSRYAAGDPSGGTGWVSQSQADNCPTSGGGGGTGGGGTGGGGDTGGGGSGGGGGFICPDWVSPDLPVFRGSATVNSIHTMEWVADIGIGLCESEVSLSFDFDDFELQLPNGSINFDNEFNLTGVGYEIGKNPQMPQIVYGILGIDSNYPLSPYIGYQQEQSASVSEIFSINNEHELRHIFRFEAPRYNFNYAYLRIPATVFMVAVLAVAAIYLVPATATYSAFAAVMVLWFTQTTGVAPGTPLQSSSLSPAMRSESYMETFQSFATTALLMEPSQNDIDLFSQQYGDMTQWADFVGLAPERDMVSAYTEFEIAGSGFTPNTEVYYEFGLPGQTPIFKNVVVADANGNISIPIEMPVPAETPLGTYLVAAFDYASINQTMLEALDGNVDPNHFLVGVATVEVVEDVTPPTITIISPVAVAYNRCDQPAAMFDVTDDLSGVASVNAWIDQTIIVNGDTMDMLFWNLGDHTLSVQAFDKVGWEQNESVTFQLQATIAGTKCALDRFKAMGLIKTNGAYTSIYAHLNNADRALASNKIEIARKSIESALKMMAAQKKQFDISAYNILLMDLNALKSAPAR